MDRTSIRISGIFSISAVLVFQGAVAGDWDPNSRAPNTGSVQNTRHNLSLTYMLISSGNPKADGTSELGYAFMGATNVTYGGAMNNYAEICVFCHTPHGANSDIKAPLWNHTLNTVAYIPYVPLSGTTGYPGPNSIMCLSCHDGTTAIDSIINMPGSGRYLATNKFSNTINNTFLDSWNGTPWNGHVQLATCSNTFTGCHGDTAPDFTVFNLGKDLRNDHPVGFKYPTTHPEFKPLDVMVPTKYAFIDNGAVDGKLQKNEVRLYDDGSSNYTVECSSCHDPHGVPSGGTGSLFIANFLRINNNGSVLCLTCHIK